MNNEDEQTCNQRIDYLNHVLNEQITKICVIEEEERMKEELQNKDEL
jgi:hypothetical protein